MSWTISLGGTFISFHTAQVQLTWLTAGNIMADSDRILVALTAISYYPQLQRIVAHGDASGISLVYLFLSAASAIEQFTIYAAHFEFNHLYPDSIVRTPPRLEDYLNLSQVSVFLLFSTVLYAALPRPFASFRLGSIRTNDPQASGVPPIPRLPCHRKVFRRRSVPSLRLRHPGPNRSLGLKIQP